MNSFHPKEQEPENVRPGPFIDFNEYLWQKKSNTANPVLKY